MKPWRTCGELLDLFSVPQSKGRECFEDLCDLGAVLARFGNYWKLSDLEKAMMKEKAYSPLIFWTCTKRAVQPLLLAGVDTLRALGVPVQDTPSTVHSLAIAVVEALKEDLAPEDKVIYDGLAAHLQDLFN